MSTSLQTQVSASPPQWRKSSFSNPPDDPVYCVEVNGTLDAVRDSKNPAGPVLSIGPSALAGLTTFLRS